MASTLSAAAHPGRARIAPAPSGRSRRWRGRGVLLVIVGALAFLVRLRLLTHGAGLASSDGYDDGVYYAAAAAFDHGRLPYRDFLLLHPPGIVLALAPFASVGAFLGDHVGVALARLAFIGIGATNAVLLAVIAGRRSRTAAVLAGLIAAVLFPLAYSERSTLLEPLGTLLLLIAVLLLRKEGHGAALVAGAVAGLAVDVKIWYVVPVLVLAASSGRRGARVLSGAAAGAAAVALPFLLADPSAMVREVLLDQLGRPSSAAHTAVRRLVLILGDPLVGSRHAVVLAASAVTAALVLASMAAAWRLRWARPFVVLGLATTAVLLVGPSFFPHYAAFAAPWLILCAAIGGSLLLERLPGRPVRLLVAAGLVAALLASNARADLQRTTAAPQPVEQLRAALATQRGCVLSDDPGLLADSDVLTRDLQHGCPLWPDVTGWTYDRDRPQRRGASRFSDARWQRDLTGYLLSGDLVVLARPSTGLSRASRQTIDALPIVLRAGGLVVHAVR